MQTLAFASFLLPLAALGAQIAQDQAVVATRLNGAPAAQLVRVDLTTGVQTPLGRFPSDVLPPLAVKIDYVSDDVVVALLLPAGGSRIVRLGLAGTQIQYERLLADVPQRVEELHVGGTAPHDDVFYAVSGSQGGLYAVPRSGGNTRQIASLPWVSAIAYVASATPVAVSSDPETLSDPYTAMVYLHSGQVVRYPPFAGFGPRTITGFHDYPTAQYFSHSDGTVSHVLAPNPVPVVQPISPLRPPGGAAAMRLTGNPTRPAVVLGGAADPTLKGYDPNSPSAQSWVFIGPPLPGDPIDFDVGFGDLPAFFFYGAACGTTSPGRQLFISGNGTLPRVGTPTFGLRVQQALSGAPVVFCAGLNDQMYGNTWLPLTLPSGCALGVAPELVQVQQANALGMTQQPLPIPSIPQLVGAHFHAQWLQQIGARIATSGVVSVRIGR